jgi:uncharacterized RDD family membrane protein YckC
MEDAYSHIRTLIREGDETQARDLLRAEIRTSPTAEAYFLASQVAYNDEQRKLMLEDALEIDPQHAGARALLTEMTQPQTPSPTPAPNVGTPFDPFAFAGRKPKDAATLGTVTAVGTLADPSSRIVAYLIDWVILLIIISVVDLVLSVLLSVVRLNNTDAGTIFLLLVNIAIQGYYYVYFLVGKNGQTLGKRLTNIRIVRKDGQPLTASDAILRNIIGYFLCGLTLLLGFLWVMIDPERQGLHDKIANTLVVKAEAKQGDRLI